MADEEQNWLEVIARSLAYLCLQQSDKKDASLTEQAEFLGNLGLRRRDAALLLGSSEQSLRVLAGRAAKSRGARKKSTSKKKTTRGRG